MYDDIGQLVWEDNSLLNRTFVYTYDDAGNILSKRTKALPAAGVTPTTLYSTYSYGYDDSWGDLLTSYRGVSITYDEIGNPLTYYNGSTYRFTWENGRRLKTASVGSNTLSFTYNHDGIRTSKTVNGVVHNYTVSGSLILTEEWGTNLVVYLYDANGAPIGMRYRTSSMAEGAFYTFWFDKNLQGDVVAVYNETGTKVLSYSYDAWGNQTTTVHNSSGTNSYAQYNAITYRGYYFDSETSLYYVASRYYDPVIGRWISAEQNVEKAKFDLEAELLAYNVFAYCANNPILYKDTSGESITIACIVILGGIGLLAGGHIAAKASKTNLGYVNGLWVLGGMVIGGGAGALLGWGVGAAATALGAYLTAGSGGTLGTVIYANWQQAEQALRNASKGVKQVFDTPFGRRVVDAFSKNVIREAKYGYQSLSQFIQQEINKDVWILNNTSVKSIEWHFYWSQVSNSGGPSGPLLEELLKHGIKVIFH